MLLFTVGQCREPDMNSAGANNDNMEFFPKATYDIINETVLTCDSKSDLDKLTEHQINERSIVNMGHIMSELKRISNHWNGNCSFADLITTKHQNFGDKIKYFVACKMCHHTDYFMSEPDNPEVLDLNRGIVAGAILTGNGYSQLQELFAAMDIRFMSNSTYQKCHDEMQKAFEAAAEEEMKAAGEEEFRLAVKRGDVKNGLPRIPVITDGSWMKRSYKSGNYDSPSGAAVIIGYYTKKVLFVGVRNKFCAICYRAAKLNQKATEHACFKNWGANQSSTSMESDIILEGFRRSIEMHGLVYYQIIANGDSSITKKLQDFCPYPSMVIEKIDCVNHLFRNLRTKIKDAGQTPGRGITKEKKVVANSLMKIVNAVVKASNYRRSEDVPWEMKIKNLRLDLSNIASHVYGEHKQCAQIGYFCDGKRKEAEVNMIPSLKSAGVLVKVEDALDYLSRFAESLLYNYTSNAAECCNSIISKMTGGKRLNLSKRGSYSARVTTASLHYSNRRALSSACESIGLQSPKTAIQLERQRITKNDKRAVRVAAAKVNPPTVTNLVSKYQPSSRKRRLPDEDYGPNAQRPDLPGEVYEDRVNKHWKFLAEQQKDRLNLEKDTRTQSDSALWRQVRKKVLTASNFGPVCKRRETTSCINLVKKILYPPNLARNHALEYGRQNESTARKQLAKKLDVQIEECGLFIDPDVSFLGATPDGLIDNETIVEIKCPISARDERPLDVIKSKKGNLWTIFDKNDHQKMNKKHDYHFQVQGQLHVTRRSKCIFAVWTPLDMHCITVERDDVFWMESMEPKLCKFYEHCLIPEIVDSRTLRSMEIREPEYIVLAQKAIAAKKHKSS